MSETDPLQSEASGAQVKGVAAVVSNTFGSGLIEITALTALIGSSTAEQLALGNRGAAGLAWVGMSTFGCSSIIRACVAGSTPNSLRDTLGVRNAAIDSAIGLNLDLSSTYMSREDLARKNLGETVGIMCENKKAVGTLSYLSASPLN
jgi:hypothetical protein